MVSAAIAKLACRCEYTALLAAHNIQPSMSRIGNPYDNAKAESFMKTLKHEEVDGRSYRDAIRSCSLSMKPL
jgi:transposase InsO family protein